MGNAQSTCYGCCAPVISLYKPASDTRCAARRRCGDASDEDDVEEPLLVIRSGPGGGYLDVDALEEDTPLSPTHDMEFQTIQPNSGAEMDADGPGPGPKMDAEGFDRPVRSRSGTLLSLVSAADRVLSTLLGSNQASGAERSGGAEGEMLLRTASAQDTTGEISFLFSESNAETDQAELLDVNHMHSQLRRRMDPGHEGAAMQGSAVVKRSHDSAKDAVDVSKPPPSAEECIGTVPEAFEDASDGDTRREDKKSPKLLQLPPIIPPPMLDIPEIASLLVPPATLAPESSPPPSQQISPMSSPHSPTVSSSRGFDHGRLSVSYLPEISTDPPGLGIDFKDMQPPATPRLSHAITPMERIPTRAMQDADFGVLGPVVGEPSRVSARLDPASTADAVQGQQAPAVAGYFDRPVAAERNESNVWAEQSRRLVARRSGFAEGYLDTEEKGGGSEGSD